MANKDLQNMLTRAGRRGIGEAASRNRFLKENLARKRAIRQHLSQIKYDQQVMKNETLGREREVHAVDTAFNRRRMKKYGVKTPTAWLRRANALGSTFMGASGEDNPFITIDPKTKIQGFGQ